MSSNSYQPVEDAKATPSRHSPAWIVSIAGAVAVLLAAAFIAGRATASGKTATPAVIVTVAAPPSTPAAPSTQARPSSSPSPLESTPGSPTAVANGRQLGSYSFDFTLSNEPYDVPLGSSRPTQSQFNTSGTGDLSSAYPGDVNILIPINGDKMLGLPSGTTPTYKACTASTLFTGQAATTEGTVFCLSETAGRMLGVTVVSSQSSYVVLRVTVWQNAS